MQPKSTDPKVYTEAIRIVNEAIGRVTVGQTGTSEGGSQSSYASLRVLNGVREDTLADYLDDIATAINRDLIEPFCRFNYNLKAIPKLQLLIPAANTDKIEQDTKLKNLGVQFKKQYIAKRYDIDEDDFDMVEPTIAPSFNSEKLKKKARYS
jgi:phage gp29-like protein